MKQSQIRRHEIIVFACMCVACMGWALICTIAFDPPISLLATIAGSGMIGVIFGSYSK